LNSNNLSARINDLNQVQFTPFQRQEQQHQNLEPEIAVQIYHSHRVSSPRANDAGFSIFDDGMHEQFTKPQEVWFENIRTNLQFCIQTEKILLIKFHGVVKMPR